MLQRKRLWVGLLVTLLFLGLFLRQAQVSRVTDALLQANLLYLLPALPLYFGGVWFRTLRWQHLLTPVRRLGARQLFRYVVMGYMANDLLPMRVGELVRAYLLGQRRGMSRAAILGTVLLERMSDGLTLVAFMAAVALVVPFTGWLEQLLKAMAALFFGALLALVLILARRQQSLALLGWLLRAASPRLARPVAVLMASFLEGMGVLQQPGRAAAVAGYAVLAWACEAGIFFSVGVALGLSPMLWLDVLAMSVANLATTLPSSQAGIGPFEYFSAQTLMVFGVDAAVAAAYALLVHAVLIVPVVLLGLAYLWQEGLSLAQVVREAQPASPGAPGR
ncbi:MAG: flippase-like domain-containing protein [Chloroflexi bacterium]|nr:flippase-like domain-containing protein [Chloroflexota bacterium]